MTLHTKKKERHIQCVRVRPLDLDTVFVAVGGASRAGALLFGEDDDMLVEENIPNACSLPPSSPTHCQLALPHQLAALRHGDLQLWKTHKNMEGVTYLALNIYHLNFYL